MACWDGTDQWRFEDDWRTKRVSLAGFPTDWVDLQARRSSIMDVGSHGCASLSDAATWFGIVFDESTGHARSALADARVTAKLLKQVMDGDYRVSPRAQEIRQRWGMGERAQTRLSMKRLELSDFLLKLKGKGNLNMKSALLGEAFWMGSRTLGRPPHAKMVSTTRMSGMRGI